MCMPGRFTVGVLAILAYPLYWVWIPPLAHKVQGKCAVVTGASSGLGVDIAKALAEEGVSKLILTARRVDKLEVVAKEISQKYPKTSVYPVACDVTSDDDNRKLVATSEEKFGGECPIILVNNAGFESSIDFSKPSKSNIDQMIDINYKSILHLINDFLPVMIKSGGHIVNMGSAAGKISPPGLHVYASTKWAVLGFSMGLRTEMRIKKYPVTIHALLPGFVKGAGMMQDKADQAGHQLDACSYGGGFGWTTPQHVSAAAVDLIKYDHPEWVVNNIPLRAVALIREAFPRLMDILLTHNPFGGECISYLLAE